MLVTLKKLFGRCSTSGCAHANKFDVCMWSLDFNEFNGESWDGAYTSFCPDCLRFGSEMMYGLVSPATGKPFYVDGRHFVRLIDGREYQLRNEQSRWTPIADFRCAAAPRHQKLEPAFQGW